MRKRKTCDLPDGIPGGGVASGRHLPDHPTLERRDGDHLLDRLEQGDEEVLVVLVGPDSDHSCI